MGVNETRGIIIRVFDDVRQKSILLGHANLHLLKVNRYAKLTDPRIACPRIASSSVATAFRKHITDRSATRSRSRTLRERNRSIGNSPSRLLLTTASKR